MSNRVHTNFRVKNSLPLDDKYLNNGVPYVNTAAVFSNIPIGERHEGLTVNINSVEHWFLGGTANVNLVPKGSSVTSQDYKLFNGVPSVLQDISTGVKIGTIFQNYNTQDEYICISNALNLAQWFKLGTDSGIFRLSDTTGVVVKNRRIIYTGELNIIKFLASPLSQSALNTALGITTTDYYSVNDGTYFYVSFSNIDYTISGTGFTANADIIEIDLLPSHITQNNCFKDCTNLENVRLNSLKTISGANTFKGCVNLFAFEAKDVYSLGNSLFENCSILDIIYIPNCETLGTTQGDNLIFNNCTNLSFLTINTFCLTSNSGSPDGDLTYAIGLGATITYTGIAAGNTGTDFSIEKSDKLITINIPTASASNRGLLSTSDWTSFTNKQNALTGTTGDIVYFSGTNVISNLAAAATGNVLISGTNPSWGKVGLTTHVNGTLAVTNGGTGLTAYTVGDILYANSATTLTTLSVGTDTYVLTLVAGLPSWQPAPGGGGGMTNPMTTLGDMIYGVSTGTPTRLVGNTSVTPMFLSQTGTGSVSAAPSWVALTNASVGLSNVVNVDTTNASNISSGTLSVGRLPAFSGDATSVAGNSVLTLATVNSDVTGPYNTITVNAKGLITAATNTTYQLPITLTTIGTSGAATLIGTTLNIPQYAAAGGGISLSSLSAVTPLFYNNTTGEFSIQVATTSQSGYLSSSDWNTFSGKQAAYTNLTSIGSLANVSGWLFNNGSGVFSYSTPTASSIGLSNVTNNAQIYSLNGLTAQIQTFGAPTTVGTTFGWTSTTSTHTLNIPLASAVGVTAGLISKAEYDVFNGKQAVLSGTGIVKSTAGTISYITGTAGQFIKGDGSLDSNTYLTANQTITLSGDVTGSGTTAITTAISSTTVTGKILTGYSTITGPSTILATDSILQAFGKLNGNIAVLNGAMIYQGTWNATTNTPDLTLSQNRVKGYVYRVSTGGTFTLDTLNKWNIGDHLHFNGSVWLKIANEVVSVFGRTGVVVATNGDYNTSQVTENTNLYFTDARARAAISLTTTGTTGAATYNSTTGVLNIPNYATGGGGGLTLSNFSATAPLLYNNTTGNFSIPAANTTTDGYLTSGNFNIFNGKQQAFAPLTSIGGVTPAAGYLYYNGSIFSYATPNNASDLTTGTLSAARLPAFSGDVTSTIGTSILTLAASGVTAGTYNNVTVNAKGLVTAATNITYQLPITLTTTGTSGAATLVGTTLNIPNYTPTPSITSLNGLTAAIQTFGAIGTTGTAPTWTSAGATHTLNIPLASTVGVTAGLISNATLTSKQNVLSGTGIVKSTAGTISYIAGTAGQFVKADGSLDSNIYLTSITGTTNRITVTGSTIDIASAYIGQNTITTLGTITAGTWNATTIAANRGGTGLTSYLAGDILYANTTSTLTTRTIGTVGQVLTVSAGLIPVWTTLTSVGITSLNGLTTATQTFGTPTTVGTTFGWTSATSTHTLNIPMASTLGVTAGLISNAEYVAKQDAYAPLSNIGALTPAIGYLYYNGSTFSYAAITSSTVGLSNVTNNAQIYSLNGLTAQVQTFGVIGTTGTAPAWNSVTSTHTLNIPLASAVGVTAGLISKANYDVFNSKQAAYTNLTSIGSLANGTGFLYNNGTGTFSYSADAANLTTGTLSAGRLPAFSGDATSVAGNSVLTLATVATAGTAGNATTVPVVTIDVKGRVTTLSTATISIPYSQINNLNTWPGSTAITTLGTITAGTWNATTIATNYGGTGLIGANAVGDIFYANSITAGAPLVRRIIGTAGQVLTVVGGLPVWSTPVTGGITSLNGLTAATQTFGAIGTTGTAPTWTSVTSTHTLNIPLANTPLVTAGLISKAEYDVFNGKQAAYTNLTSIGSLANAAGFLYNNGTGTFSYSASASNLTTGTLSVGRLPAFSGDATATIGTGVLTLATVATAGTAGNATTVPVVTIDVKGRTTTLSTATISIPYSQINNIGSWPGSTAITTLGTVITGTWNATAVATNYGGTGLTGANAVGDMFYASSAVVGASLARRIIGTAGQVLTVVGGLPTWTTLTGIGITSLNGLTAATQTFSNATGAGLLPNWSTSGGNNHILNIPLASTASVTQGLLSNADYLVFNGKQAALSGTGIVRSTAGAISYITGTAGSLMYFTGTNTSANLAAAATGNVLISGTNPSWGKVGLTTHVSGTLPTNNGGTGLTTYAVGDILYANSATAGAPLVKVSMSIADVGKVLTVNGTGTAPIWATLPTTQQFSYQEFNSPAVVNLNSTTHYTVVDISDIEPTTFVLPLASANPKVIFNIQTLGLYGGSAIGHATRIRRSGADTINGLIPPSYPTTTPAINSNDYLMPAVIQGFVWSTSPVHRFTVTLQSNGVNGWTIIHMSGIDWVEANGGSWQQTYNGYSFKEVFF